MTERTVDAVHVREQLRAFVRDHGRGTQGGPALHDRTPLLEDRIITSLQVPELLLLIESLRGREVDVLDLQPGDLRDIETIVERFFP